MCIKSGTDVVYFFMQMEDDFTSPVIVSEWVVLWYNIQYITAGDWFLLELMTIAMALRFVSVMSYLLQVWPL